MAMINMKREPEREEMPGEIEGDEPQYPYGLCISLEQDDLEKLGITALPKVGVEMTVTARAYVKSTSAYDTQGEGKRMSVSLQITDLELGGGQNERTDNLATMLYGAA